MWEESFKGEPNEELNGDHGVPTRHSQPMRERVNLREFEERVKGAHEQTQESLGRDSGLMCLRMSSFRDTVTIANNTERRAVL